MMGPPVFASLPARSVTDIGTRSVVGSFGTTCPPSHRVSSTGRPRPLPPAPATARAHHAEAFVDGHAGGVADTTACRQLGVAGRVGIGHAWANALDGNAESSATICACATRVPPISGFPVMTAALPSALKVTVALELMPALNQNPQASPRP